MALTDPNSSPTGATSSAIPPQSQEESPAELALEGGSILDPIVEPIATAAAATVLAAIALVIQGAQLTIEGAQEVGEWIVEGFQHLDRTVRDFLHSNPSEEALREVASGLRELEQTLRENGLPGAEEVDELEKLLREPLKAKQRERGEDRNPAQDKKLTRGEEEALKKAAKTYTK